MRCQQPPLRPANRAGSGQAIAAAVLATSLVAGRASAATTANWLTATDGSWTDPARWSSNPYFPRNGVPGGTDSYDVTIGASGAAYAVTIDASALPGGAITVDRLTLGSSDATLVASGGTVQASLGLNVNAGVFRLAGGSLRNTVVTGTSGARMEVPAGAGYLDGVELGLSVQIADQGLLRASNGLRLAGASISIRGLNANSNTGIQLVNSTTLDGAGEIVFDGTGGITSWAERPWPSGRAWSSAPARRVAKSGAPTPR